MAKRKRPQIIVHLTERALRDIVEIEAYSVEQFGRRVANRYLSDLQSALLLIADNPGILRDEPGIHSWLKFYRSGKHLLVCDVGPERVFVLTLIGATMDIPSRLADLEPALSTETELLRRKLRSGDK